MSNWIEWNGGECPVAGEDLVQVRLRDGTEDRASDYSLARAIDWTHNGFREWEVVAYRHYRHGAEQRPLASSALSTQPSGTHYSDSAIQPVQFIEANKLGFLEGCIVKRATRHNHPTGKGAEDIRKIIHEARLILELRYGEAT